MTREFDLVVIGTGTAARVVATRMRDAGWSVAVADAKPFGGTCALRGCDPKKMLVGGTDAVDHARRMRGLGVKGEAAVDWSELVAFKRGFTEPVPGKQETLYADRGIETFRGHARFAAPDAVEVDGTTLGARHVVIAAGARPVPLGIPGDEHLVDNEGFMDLERLPRRIVFVGGGYIAAEFSHIAARAGAQVTVLQRGPRMLKGFDADLVGWLMERFGDIGIDVRTGASVEAIEKAGDAYRVVASQGGDTLTVEADLVVHASGRIPNLEGLDLERGNVATRDGRLELDEHLRSVSNPNVYAAGDAAQAGPPLTPVSSHDAKVVVENLLHGPHLRPDYRGVPSVAFTIPPIAAVGLDEERARKQGLRFRTNARSVPQWFTARQAAETVYGYKVLIEEDTGRILGAHLVGPHAEETINLFALALRHSLTSDHLADTMFAYPTAASDLSSMLS
ncbi:dihydrolipoyl dehydrogenase family protein [Lutibaculum baratangense]|uniref:Glutathione reductase n=1 Tax=Lutibaculum baratangense AMV1 TaxID=631454 RepID=V4RGX2_9HYPH|nr:NAD(P)/FAD-dependent oxidoreductase [Lutibaculum baratangense]ESR24619.1 glutathione reductase [Lutibaculum baratangense AMV1]